MPKIFISYRRRDNPYSAHQIYSNLVDHFGSECVVFDVDTIPVGIDFRDYIKKQVSKCDILLAVIGDQWIEILKQRLNDPNDFIRIEIQAALERQIPVVPVLVDKASVPDEKDLPQELAGLAYKQAAEVRAGPDLRVHLQRLIEGLDRHAIPKTYTNSVGMKFVLIPPGNFIMGSKIGLNIVKILQDKMYGVTPKAVARGQIGFESEIPQHEVRISKSFYLQTTTVTQGHWKKVMRNNPSFFKACGDDCPVESVSWRNLKKFIDKLNIAEITDDYRLPTEAEWEYACRARTITEFAFGNDTKKLDKFAWYIENSEGKPHPVKTKEPNAWGLYDMHGNVYELVEDNWYKNYKGAPKDGSARVRKMSGMLSHVIRGGSWQSIAYVCRSACRFCHTNPQSVNASGFRVAKTVAFSP